MKAHKNLAFACFLKKYIIKRRLLIVLGATRAVEGFHGSDVTVIPLESLSQETVIEEFTRPHGWVWGWVWGWGWVCFLGSVASQLRIYFAPRGHRDTHQRAHTAHAPRSLNG